VRCVLIDSAANRRAIELRIVGHVGWKVSPVGKNPAVLVNILAQDVGSVPAPPRLSFPRHAERQAWLDRRPGTELLIGHVRLENGLIFRCELEAQVGQAVGTATGCHFPFKSGYFKSSKACASIGMSDPALRTVAIIKSRKRMASSFASQVPRGVNLETPLSLVIAERGASIAIAGYP
jgi:hypothetical protein